MFGDNQGVTTRSTLPHSQLNKCHNVLSYHCVSEAIASDVLWFFHMAGTQNPADILTKFCGHAVFWPLIKPFLFWHGEPPPSPDFCQHYVQSGVSNETF
jgi:hypothetical protein